MRLPVNTGENLKFKDHAMKYCRCFASQLKEVAIKFEGTAEPGNVNFTVNPCQALYW